MLTLHDAAKTGKMVAVLYWLEQEDTDVNAKLDGKLALSEAAKNGHAEVVKVLLQNGADFTSLSHEGALPLHYAAQRGYGKVILALLGHGADINAKGEYKYGCTALHIAASIGCAETTRLLIQNGAEMSATNHFSGYTPLHCAVQHGKIEALRVLIQSKADVNAIHQSRGAVLQKGGHGEFLFKIATIMKALLDARDCKYGMTPLYLAVKQSQIQALQCLLQAGADPDVSNLNGKTARDLLKVRKDDFSREALCLIQWSDIIRNMRILKQVHRSGGLFFSTKKEMAKMGSLPLAKIAIAMAGGNLTDEVLLARVQSVTPFPSVISKSPSQTSWMKVSAFFTVVFIALVVGHLSQNNSKLVSRAPGFSL